MVKQLAFVIALLFSLQASADLCPKQGEVIATTPYQLSTACPAATIIVKGERNPDEYESCLGDVPYAREQVFYVTKDKKHLPLPTVSSLLPSGNSFKSRLWVVGDLDLMNIKCDGTNVVSIAFWSGGNCAGCTRTVNYVFGSDGRLQKARLK